MTNPSDLTDEAGCRELCRRYGLSSHPSQDLKQPCGCGPCRAEAKAMSALAEAVRMMREKAAVTVSAYRGESFDLREIVAAILALQLTAEDIKRGE